MTFQGKGITRIDIVIRGQCKEITLQGNGIAGKGHCKETTLQGNVKMLHAGNAPSLCSRDDETQLAEIITKYIIK